MRTCKPWEHRYDTALDRSYLDCVKCNPVRLALLGTDAKLYASLITDEARTALTILHERREI